MYQWVCDLCGEGEEAYFYYGDMTLEPVRINGRMLFSLNSEPGVVSYWHFNPRSETELQIAIKRESDLVNKISTALSKRIKMTIAGPCTAPAKKGRHAFNIGDAFAWPPVVAPDGILVMVDPEEVHKALSNNQQAPASIKPKSEPIQAPAREPSPQVPPEKPTPLLVPPELR